VADEYDLVPESEFQEPQPKETPRVPEAFMQRLRQGSILGRMVDFAEKLGGAAFEGAKEGFGQGLTKDFTMGFDPGGSGETFLRSIGLFAPEGGAPFSHPVNISEGLIRSSAIALDTITRLTNAGIVSAAEVARELRKEPGQDDQTEANRLKRDLVSMGQIGLLVGGSAPIYRTRMTPTGPKEEVIGRLPEKVDFDSTAAVVADGVPDPAVAQKLTRLWEDHGIHPAEVVADMKANPEIQASLLSRTPDLPEAYAGIAREEILPPGGGGRPPVEPPKSPGFPEEPPSGPPGVMNLAEANMRVESRLSIGEDTQGRPYTMERFIKDTQDKFYPLLRASGDRGPAESAYVAAREYAGHSAKSRLFIEDGPRDFYTFQKVGPGLEEILAPVKKDFRQFRIFSAAAHAAELERRGIATGVDMVAAQRVVEAGKAAYGATMLKLVEFQNQVAAYLRDSGVISKAGYEAMVEANKLYIPFNRVMQPPEGVKVSGKNNLNPRTPIHMYEGSERRIIDPFETIIRNVHTYVEMAERNQVTTKLIDGLLADEAKAAGKKTPGTEVARVEPDLTGMSAQVSTVDEILRKAGMENPPETLMEMLAEAQMPLRDGEVRVYRDGRPTTYLIDPELANAVKGMDVKTVGPWTQIAAAFTSMLKTGALLTPDFWLRHITREPVAGAATYRGEGVLTPKSVVEAVVGQITKDKDYHDYIMGGGAHSSFVALDRNYLQLDLQKYQAETGLFTRSWNVIVDPSTPMGQRALEAVKLPGKAVKGAYEKFWLHPAQAVTEVVMETTHFAAYKQRIKELNAKADPAFKGELVVREGVDFDTALQAAERARATSDTAEKKRILDAAWVARNTGVDNARIGAKMAAVDAVVAFANSKIQDLPSIYQAFKEKPVTTSAIVSGSIVLPSVLTYLNGRDDPRYTEDSLRDVMYVIPTDRWVQVKAEDVKGLPPHMVRLAGGEYFRNEGITLRIPKPFVLGVFFGSGAERVLESADKNSGFATAKFMKAMQETVIGDFTPTIVSPIIQQWTNTNFRGQRVIPGYLEPQLPEYQYTPYTTETAKALGMFMSQMPGLQEGRVGNTTLPILGGTSRALTSPMLVENYIRGWTGGLGVYALKIADAGLRKSGVVYDPPNKMPWQLSDIPAIGGFIARYPAMNSSVISEFYDNQEKAERYYQTFQRQAKAGNIDAVERLMGDRMNTMAARMTGVREAMTTINQTVQRVHADPKIPGAEKRQLIENMYFTMITLARGGRDAQNAIIKSFEGAKK